jgi:hypothetical protein
MLLCWDYNESIIPALKIKIDSRIVCSNAWDGDNQLITAIEK